MDPPSYPTPDDSAAEGRLAPTTMSWGVRIGLAAAVVALVLIVVLHLTGVVGPASN